MLNNPPNNLGAHDSEVTRLWVKFVQTRGILDSVKGRLNDLETFLMVHSPEALKAFETWEASIARLKATPDGEGP